MAKKTYKESGIIEFEHEGVINREAYEKWKELMAMPILNEKRVYTTSDGIELDLANLPHIIQKRTNHLPILEQKKIALLKSSYYAVLNNANVFKRQAFKTKALKGMSYDNQSIIDTKKEPIISLFGKMFSTQEVLKICNEEYKLTTTLEALQQFKKRNAEAIAIQIEEYKKTYSDSRFGVRRGRIEEIVELYNVQKSKWNKTKSREDLKPLLSMLEQLRKETDGDRLTIEGNIDLNVQQVMNEHIRTEIFKFLPLREIIIARIASKMRVNPTILLKSLNDSYYSKFSKLLNIDAVDAEEVGMFPSNQPYDFIQIEKRHEIEKNTPKPLPIEIEPKALSLKEIILNQVKKKQTDTITAEIENEAFEEIKKSKK